MWHWGNRSLTTQKMQTASPGSTQSQSEKVQHGIQIQLLADSQLIFRPGQVVKQKFKNQRTAKAAPLDLELGEAPRQVGIPDGLDADKAGVRHRPGEAIPARCAGALQ